MDDDERKLLREACSQVESAMLRVVGVLRDPDLPDNYRRDLDGMAEELEMVVQHLYSLCRQP